jgi:hypothetical protein
MRELLHDVAAPDERDPARVALVFPKTRLQKRDFAWPPVNDGGPPEEGPPS